jgi:hypothetical protein
MSKVSFRSAAPARGRKVSVGLLALGVALCNGSGTARSYGQDSTNLPPVLPPPEFMEKKVPLPDLLLKDKRAGRYVTGFPAIGWDPETGFNYGAAVQWFDNGPADSPFFRYTPYRELTVNRSRLEQRAARVVPTGHCWVTTSPMLRIRRGDCVSLGASNKTTARTTSALGSQPSAR